MHSKSLKLFISSAVLFLSNVLLGSEHEFDRTDIKGIDVKVDTGTVKLDQSSATERARTTLSIQKRESGNCQVRVHNEGGILRIAINKRGILTDDCQYDVALSGVPTDIPISVEQTAGKVSIDGSFQSVGVDMGAGKYNFHGYSRDHEVKLGAGKIRVDYDERAQEGGKLNFRANASVVRGSFPNGSRLLLTKRTNLSSVKLCSKSSEKNGKTFDVGIEGTGVNAKFH